MMSDNSSVKENSDEKEMAAPEQLNPNNSIAAISWNASSINRVEGAASQMDLNSSFQSLNSARSFHS